MELAFLFFLGRGGGGGERKWLRHMYLYQVGGGKGKMVNTGATEDDEELSC